MIAGWHKMRLIIMKVLMRKGIFVSLSQGCQRVADGRREEGIIEGATREKVGILLS